MKIVIVSPAFPLRGGIADFAAQLYIELAKENEVSVFTFKRQYPRIFFPGKTQLSVGDDDSKIPTSVEIDSINPLTWFSTASKIISLKPDVVIFKYWMPFFAPCYRTIAKRIKKITQAKLVAVCHNVIPHEKKFGDEFLTKSFLGVIDYFVLLSEEVKKDLMEFVQNPKAIVLPHPVYSKFGEAVNKIDAKNYLGLTKKNYILFFGIIRNYKGLDILIEALSMVKNDVNLNLIVAGEFYDDQKKYLDLIEKFDLKNRVILFDKFIPANEVKYYFCAADTLILPYRDATQSGIMQIAVNFNKPVIATNVGGISEVIENSKNGYIVEKENPLKLAEAITKFYKEEKLESFTNNISTLKEKYSWKYFVNGIYKLIKS